MKMLTELTMNEIKSISLIPGLIGEYWGGIYKLLTEDKVQYVNMGKKEAVNCRS